MPACTQQLGPGLHRYLLTVVIADDRIEALNTSSSLRWALSDVRILPKVAPDSSGSSFLSCMSGTGAQRRWPDCAVSGAGQCGIAPGRSEKA